MTSRSMVEDIGLYQNDLDSRVDDERGDIEDLREALLDRKVKGEKEKC